ncbi:MAG TPA: hypothetical protein VHV77_00890, partial [Pirellulales bacterium]|nr:hypothetical protein [Pirellulales bacterium]
MRFFDLQTNSGSNSAMDFSNPASIGNFQSSQFRMYAVDLEATRELYLRNSIAMTSFGVRTAGVSFGQSTTNTLVAPTAGDLLVASAATNNSFYGTGLTSATQWMRPVYQGAFGNIGFYGMGRGSVLWGNENSSAVTQATVFGPGAVASSRNGATFGPGNTMWIGELQAGIQWNKVLTNFLHTRAFARVAFEYQNWGLGTIGNARSLSVAQRT